MASGLLLRRVLEGVRSQARRTGHLVIRCSLFRKTLKNHSSASEGELIFLMMLLGTPTTRSAFN